MSKLEHKTLAHLTLGCKVNMYDTSAMVEILQNHGVHAIDFESKADIYIINTCTVTNLGDKKSRQAIRKATKLNPDAIVVVCGCYSQTHPEAVKAIEGVDIVLGTKDRMKIAEFIIQYLESKEQQSFVGSVNDAAEFEELNINDAQGTRAYIKIQEGCDNYCSYCIIPYARGSVRSRDFKNILEEAARLSETGVKEIVLTGINIGSYGKDKANGLNLSKLIRALHEIQGIMRIRLGSVDPIAITDEFLETLKDCCKLCAHLHLSLQSGCDKILSAMNRRYSTSEYRKTVTNLRAIRPNIGITTDIIVGFPGESDDDFAQSYEFAKNMAFSKIHVFPYSPKAGTKAAGMGNHISSQVKNSRAKAMSELGSELCEEFAKKFENTKLSVLFEHEIGNNIFEGYSDNYIIVRQNSDADLKNQVLEVECVYDGEGRLRGV